MEEEKLQATLTDETLGQNCDLNRALEMVALLEAQLKEMNPNLDSISEYYSLSIYEIGTPKCFSSISILSYVEYVRYRCKASLYNQRVEDLNQVTQERDEIRKQYDEWRKRRYGFFSYFDL